MIWYNTISHDTMLQYLYLPKIQCGTIRGYKIQWYTAWYDTTQYTIRYYRITQVTIKYYYHIKKNIKCCSICSDFFHFNNFTCRISQEWRHLVDWEVNEYITQEHKSLSLSLSRIYVSLNQKIAKYIFFSLWYYCVWFVSPTARQQTD